MELPVEPVTGKEEIHFRALGVDDGGIQRYVWHSSLDGEFYNWAALKSTETIDITTELVNKVTEQDWEVTLKSRIEESGKDPTEDDMAQWAIDHTELMEKRFARHTLRKPEPLGTRSARKPVSGSTCPLRLTSNS